MSDKIRSRVLLIVLLIGFCAALALCARRVGLEAANSRVCVVMTEAAAGQIDGLPEGIRLFDGSVYQDEAVLLVEDDRQYSFVPDEGTQVLLAQFPVGAAAGGVAYARCFHLTEKYAARYGALGYAGAEEIENILYRAATDRNIRVLWLEPFTDARSGETVTDGEVYRALLDALRARLQRHGLTLGDTFSVFPAWEPPLLPLVLSAFGVASVGVLLLTEGFGLKKRYSLWVLAVACILAALLLIAARHAALRVGAFAAAVLFPCLAVTLLINRLREARLASLSRELASAAGVAAACFGISLAGGLFVGAFQSGVRWLLAIDNFRGVKLSQLLPLVYAAFLILRRLSPLREIRSGKRGLIVFALLAAAAAVLLLLLRSGDGTLPVAQAELRARNALEHFFLVRPRTKEFLVAWPCLGIAWVLCLRGAKRYAWPFALLSTVGFSSVVNSFCHSRAPVWVSTVRGVTAFLIGLAVILVLTALLHRRTENLSEN